MTDLASRLRSARHALGWSLRKAADRSGVPNAHISQLETGTIRQPGMTVLGRLAVAYGIPLMELLALAGAADFGAAAEDGRLEDYEGHSLWRMSVYLPDGREGEAIAWMTMHGLEVYRAQKVEDIAAGRGE